MQVCFLANNCKMAIRAGCASALAYLASLLSLTVNSIDFDAPIIISQYYDKYLEHQCFFLKELFYLNELKGFAGFIPVKKIS